MTRMIRIFLAVLCLGFALMYAPSASATETETAVMAKDISGVGLVKDHARFYKAYELFDKKTPVYTITPGLDEKLDLITAATVGTFSKASSIHQLMTANSKTNPMFVEVTSMPGMSLPDDFKPKSTVSINTTSLETLASKIAAKMLGDTGNGVGDGENGVATISDIVNILTYGTISVKDEGLEDSVYEINKNLL